MFLRKLVTFAKPKLNLIAANQHDFSLFQSS
jgi:hypothetical protein